MGGFMQPQGHVQLLVSMIDYGLEPQLAIERPRFCIDVENDAANEERSSTDGGADASRPCSAVSFEHAFDRATIDELRSKGHTVTTASFVESHGLYGRAQIIRRLDHPGSEGVLWAGSDPRADGCAMGW